MHHALLGMINQSIKFIQAVQQVTNIYDKNAWYVPNQLLPVPNRILNGSAKQPFFDVQIPFRIKQVGAPTVPSAFIASSRE
jgi:hypothetical protein